MNQVVRNGVPAEVDTRMWTVAFHGEGRQQLAKVVVVRELASGVYWWTYERAAKTEDVVDLITHPWFLYFMDGGAIGFRCNKALWIHPVHNQGGDPAAVEKAVLGELDTVGKAERERRSLPWDIEISSGKLRESLGDDFFFMPGFSVSLSPRVVAVTRRDDLWVVRLAGPNADFADVSLDTRFALVGARRLGTSTIR